MSQRVGHNLERWFGGWEEGYEKSFDVFYNCCYPGASGGPGPPREALLL